jgi:hypothetical protein
VYFAVPCTLSKKGVIVFLPRGIRLVLTVTVHENHGKSALHIHEFPVASLLENSMIMWQRHPLNTATVRWSLHFRTLGYIAPAKPPTKPCLSSPLGAVGFMAKAIKEATEDKLRQNQVPWMVAYIICIELVASKPDHH